MMKTTSDPNKYSLYRLVQGYEYIESFKKRIKNGYELSDKQWTMLYRLARPIAINIIKNDNDLRDKYNV